MKLTEIILFLLKIIMLKYGQGFGDGQGGLACCNSWGRKEWDTTE